MSQGAEDRRTPRSERLFAVVAGLALVALAYRYMDLYGDSFWSIATGRFLIEHRAFPAVDPFSYTARGTPWVVHMPLTQLLFAVVADGVALLVGVEPSALGAVPPAPSIALLALCLLGAVVHASAQLLLILSHARSLERRVVGFLLAALVVWTQRNDLGVRGQLFGDLGFAVTLVLLGRLRRGRRLSWWVGVALGAVWVQMHASFFLAVALPAFYALLVFLDTRRAAAAWPFAQLALGVAAGSLLNPYGHRLPLDLIALMRATSTRSLDLFSAPTLHDPEIAICFGAILVIAWLALRKDATKIDALSLVVLTCASATSRRFLPLALTMALALILRSPWPAWPRKNRLARVFRPALGVGLAAAVAVFGASAHKDPYRDVPMVEVAAVEKLGLPDRVFALYHWGGYLAYAWHERRSTFIDGRNQLFENGTFDAAMRLASATNTVETLFAYRVNTVVAERESSLSAELASNPAWHIVRTGRIATLFVRQVPMKPDPLGPAPTLGQRPPGSRVPNDGSRLFPIFNEHFGLRQGSAPHGFTPLPGNAIRY